MLRKIIQLIFYFSNGLNKINNWGNNINDESKAISIAILVKIPKYILGIKFENIKLIEDKFSNSIILSRNGKIKIESSGLEKYSININKSNFKNEIAPARAFGFMEEYKKLKKAGFAKGASLSNCVVLNGKKILNKNGLRYKNEFIRHKILDVIGDLHLSGYSILGHFKGDKSGHKTNYELLKKIFSDKSSFTLVNMNKPDKKENNIIALQIPNQIAS